MNLALDAATNVHLTYQGATAVLRARSLTPHGDGAKDCDECGEPIPKRRREALPGVRTCIACQSARDKAASPAGINRRGSKDSQLR